MTLGYRWPTIYSIEDVLPHIDDYFRVVEKEGYTYINYNFMGSEVFPPVEGSHEEQLRAAVRRECRGITFDSATGAIVSRPFHKFFNLGEPSAGDSINPLSASHQMLEKLDGSMVRPLPNGRWATKMGVSDVALDAEAFVAKNLNHEKFAKAQASFGQTPIFEYVGPHNRIVLEYEEDLILLAIRDNITGRYLSYGTMLGAAAPFCIPVVKNVRYSIDAVRQDETSEGIVIRYSDGHMLKVKSDWYVKIHKAKDLLTNDRRFVEAILNQTLDDVITSFLPEDQERVKKKWERFSKHFERLKGLLYLVESKEREKHQEKKDFAIASKDWGSDRNVERQYIFQRWDEKVPNAEEFLLNRLKSAIGNNKRFDETMKELGFEL